MLKDIKLKDEEYCNECPCLTYLVHSAPNTILYSEFGNNLQLCNIKVAYCKFYKVYILVDGFYFKEGSLVKRPKRC